ncbi:MAG: hypothetical protein ACRDQU_15275 [Pseudonocardiaceae bacterium]
MGRSALVAFNKQVRQLPAELQAQECGLIEIGRQHARDFDAGHSPSGGGVQRVLRELRALAKQLAPVAAAERRVEARSELDALRERRAAHRAPDASHL